MGNLLLVLLTMLMPSLALAQSGPFTPVPDDISVKVINQIFGSLVNGGNDAFGGAISTFNGAVLMVGGILATYTILAGTIGTAHDGEVLGKKFSSVWIPIRYCLGTALVLPVLNGGYCVMQQLVMWLVLQGIGMADSVWDSYMQTPGIAANISVNKNTEDKIRALAENVFIAQVCVEANKFALSEADGILEMPSRYDYKAIYDGNKRTYNFGDHKGVTSGWSKNDCGEVTFGEQVKNSTVASGPTTTNVGYLGPLDNLFAPTDIQGINTAHEIATAQLVVFASGAAKSMILDSNEFDNSKAETYYKKIDVATAAYLEYIKAAATTVAMSPSDTTKAAHKHGWFLAGAYFMNTIVTNNKITNAIAGVPDSKFGKSSYNDQAESLQAIGLKVLAFGNPDFGSAANAINEKKDNETSKATAELGWSGRAVNAITRGLTAIDLYQLKNDPRHPVIVINEMGNRLQTFWTVMIGSLLTLTVAGGVAALVKSSIATTVTNVLVVLIGFLGLPIMALAATSFTASYLIPMLPFMMWLGILGGWLIAVVIAVLAAPLWAIMHLHPNGDDLTGRGGNGYMMVLSLLLRPALAIFGFIAAIVISSVMGEFINKVFFQVFSFSQGDGKGLGFFIGVIAGAAIYVAIMFSFVKKTFGLMHVIPDELMKWIGGGSDQLGHYAGKMGEGSNSGVAQVAAFTAGRGLSQGMQNAGRQIGDMNKQAKAVKEGLANKEVNGLKGLNAISADFDKMYGAGSGERITSMLGLEGKNIDSSDSQAKLGAFNQGMRLAGAHAGDEGQSAFINGMEQSSSNGFSQHGSASEAAQFLSQNIASKSVLAQAESRFGSKGVEQLRSMAPHKSGDPNLLDLNKAGNAMAELAVQHKASQPAHQEAAVGEVAALVKDTPLFNPTLGEVEGGEQPQQATFDLRSDSVQPSVVQSEVPGKPIQIDEQKE